MMSDFEFSIIQACREVYPQVPVAACFFHLGQSVYRQVQGRGLQGAYNDPQDRSVKQYTHMLLALAFVPVGDVPSAFVELRAACPPVLNPIMDYFDETYINGRPAITRRVGRAQRSSVPARYEPGLWNQYNAAIAKLHRTNNVSEGWHNRFRVVVGKHHPDLYGCLVELQKEQSYTESSLAELAMGKRVKALPKKQWTALQVRMQDIANDYGTYKAAGTTLDYLRAIGYNIVLSGEET